VRLKLWGLWDLGNIAAASRLLEEAAVSPNAFEEKFSAAGAALGFDHFSVWRSGPSAGAAEARQEANAHGTREIDGWLGSNLRVGEIRDGKPLPDQSVQEQEWRRPAPWTSGLSVRLHAGHYAGWTYPIDRSLWILALVRSPARGPVSQMEARELEQVIPVANRALHVTHHIVETHVRGLFDGLATSRAAAILLGRDGRVQHVTPQASGMFGSDFGLRDGALWSAHTASNLKLEEVAASAGLAEHAVAFSSFPIVRFNDPRPLLARPVPVHGRGPRSVWGLRIALFLSGQGRSAMANAADLQLLFGFTRAEAQITLLLGEGLEPQQIAVRRETSVGTVRVQMKQIFQKANVSRQSDLIRMLVDVSPPHVISYL
jgi:DNA-binding CsgD family transcriptional regulator